MNIFSEKLPDKMKIITFKNGNQIKVSDEIVRIIADQVTKPLGATGFQFFSEVDGKVYLAINVQDISSIHGKENII